MVFMFHYRIVITNCQTAALGARCIRTEELAYQFCMLCHRQRAASALCVIQPLMLTLHLGGARQQHANLMNTKKCMNTHTHLQPCSVILISLWTRQARISRPVDRIPLSCSSQSQSTWFCL